MSRHRGRVARLEGTLTAQQVVMLWLVEAGRFADIDTYGRAVVEGECPPPLTFIHDAITKAADGRAGRARPDVRQAAVLVDWEDALVLYHLVLGINDQAAMVERHERMRLALLRSLLGTLEPADVRPVAVGTASNGANGAGRWTTWLATVHDLARDLLLDDRARRAIEAQFFAGHLVLFAPLATAWDEVTADAVDLVRIARAIEGVSSTGRDGLEPQDGPTVTRMEELLDDARIEAFRTLDDHERAREILHRRADRGEQRE